MSHKLVIFSDDSGTTVGIVIATVRLTAPACERSQIAGRKEEQQSRGKAFKLLQGNGQWTQAHLEYLSDGIYLK